MEKIQKLLVNNDISIKIYIDEDLNEPASFCPTCDFVMSSQTDFEYFDKFSCCSFCAMKFAESRKEDWKNGWRPSENEVEEFKKLLRLQSPVFILD